MHLFILFIYFFNCRTKGAKDLPLDKKRKLSQKSTMSKAHQLVQKAKTGNKKLPVETKVNYPA